MTRRCSALILPVVALAALAGALTLASGLAGAQEPPPGSTPNPDHHIHLLAIDAITTGNDATRLGPLDGCVRTEVGAKVSVDLIVDSIPADRPIIAYQLGVTYDPKLLEVVAEDKNMLLGAVGQFQPFEAFNDPLPDTNGLLDLGILDTASNDGGPGKNVESGPGVLARITFQALAAGVSTVAPAPAKDQNYPAIIDYMNDDPIDIDNLGAAQIAVGQDCPGGAPPVQLTAQPPLESLITPQAGTTPAPARTFPPSSPGASGTPAASPSGTPSASGAAAGIGNAGGTTSGGGSNTGLIVLAVALGAGGLAAAGGGGWLLYRRRQAGSRAVGGGDSAVP